MYDLLNLIAQITFLSPILMLHALMAAVTNLYAKS
jgi:hypothetical protein